jgi:hypothetical protein
VEDRKAARAPGLILNGSKGRMLLKNSDFRFDHNSEDGWRPGCKIL